MTDSDAVLEQLEELWDGSFLAELEQDLETRVFSGYADVIFVEATLDAQKDDDDLA